MGSRLGLAHLTFYQLVIELREQASSGAATTPRELVLLRELSDQWAMVR